VRTYCASVRVGNWNEDIQLEEDTLKDFLEKREKGQLLTQQSASLTNAVSAKVDVSVARDGKVHFGDTVMVVNPAPKDGSRGDMALSMSVAGDKAGTAGVSASCNTSPTARNTFVIMSCDGTANGETLTYGQPFYLCTTNGKMFLFSDRATFQKSAKKSRHNAVSLTAEPSHCTKWQIKPKDPKYRMELEYSPVLANEISIFTHMKTNSNLNLEADFTMRSQFGRENEVSCHTDLDSHRAEKDTNHWRLTMSVPGDPCMEVPPQ